MLRAAPYEFGELLMPRRLLALAACAALGALLAASAQARTDRVAGTASVVVLLTPGTASAPAAQKQAQKLGFMVSEVYGHALAGYAADVPLDELGALRSEPGVASVVADSTFSALGQTLPWGVDRLDADLSSTRAGDGSGAVLNVHVYVVDTGVDNRADDLNAVGEVSFVKRPKRDCNGHGTHVAGTIAAADNGLDVVGVAPGAPVTGVKVVDCEGNTTLSALLAGVDWVTANAVKPAVANMSIGGPATDALDEAIRTSAASGVLWTLAAGNDGGSACNVSPARAGLGAANGIVTVAATDQADAEASFSDFGPCVDLWAPGVSILSLAPKRGTATMSGTSSAAPHVAGAAALYLSTHPSAGPAAVEAALQASAVTPGSKSKDGDPVRLAYAGRY
jgi:subtilisin family serine protease